MAVTTPPPVLGKPCPPFSLPAVDGRSWALADFARSRCLLVVFTCNHCPYAQAVEGRIIALARAYAVDDLQVVAICSNDADMHPEDSVDNLRERWHSKEMPFPYLHDDSQEVGRKFGAVCTPDFFLYDRERALRYRGRLDDSWRDESLVSRHELREAIDALLGGGHPSDVQHPSLGCSIRWRS